MQAGGECDGEGSDREKAQVEFGCAGKSRYDVGLGVGRVDDSVGER